MSEPLTVEQAAAAVNAATDAYKAAEEAAAMAQNRSCDALNELNRAQKEFDTIVAAIKKAAPHGSNWAEQKRGATA